MDSYISRNVLETLETGGPMTVDELSEACSLPLAHVRAAVSELCYRDRLVSSDGQKMVANPPPEEWPKLKGS